MEILTLKLYAKSYVQNKSSREQVYSKTLLFLVELTIQFIKECAYGRFYLRHGL